MSKKGEGSLSWLRDRNRRRGLDVRRISGRKSQADIARATGLSRTTIHTLISELKDAGMVLEVDGRPASTGSGRPAVQLVLQKTSRAVLGIDFGHSHVQVAVADLAHNVLAERHRDLDVNHRAKEALDFSAEMAAEVLGEVGIDRSRVIGAGIGIPGPVDRERGTAGEIGHTTLDERGALCYCGNRGCLETVASGPAITRLVAEGNGEAPSLAEVIERASAGDVRCRRAISDAGREIGVAVAGLCNLINPERVIIGGLLSRAGDILLQPLRESIRRHAVQAAAERVDVRAACFVDRAELLGALALALRGQRAHEALG